MQKHRLSTPTVQPGAFKDRELMQKNPHADRVIIAPTRWREAFIYIHGSTARADVLEAALAAEPASSART
jgi:NADH:ubiquinone oxidoreductase subunit F (NADH-binding)